MSILTISNDFFFFKNQGTKLDFLRGALTWFSKTPVLVELITK